MVERLTLEILEKFIKEAEPYRLKPLIGRDILRENPNAIDGVNEPINPDGEYYTIYG